MKLYFHAYVERRKRSLIVSWTSILGLWSVYRVRAIRGASRGHVTPLNSTKPVAAAKLGFWVLLRHFLSLTVVVVTVCETPPCEPNHSSCKFSYIFLILVCVLDSLTRTSLIGEVNSCAHGLITNGAVV